jgi:hypothetical protein
MAASSSLPSSSGSSPSASSPTAAACPTIPLGPGLPALSAASLLSSLRSRSGVARAVQHSSRAPFLGRGLDFGKEEDFFAKWL